MADTVQYRLVTDDDGPALEALIAACPDAGTIGFTHEYRGDLLAIHRAFADDLQGVVAIRDGTVIGMVFGELLEVRWGGELSQAIYLSNLRVHPDFRRQGVGRGLAEWGFAYVMEQIGSETMMYAAIQEENVSLSLAERYQFRATNLIKGAIIPMRRSPPRSQGELAVRAAKEMDLSAVAMGMNSFYREHNLWSPVTATSLRECQSQEVCGVRPNQIYIVTRNERVVGGLSVSDRTRLVRMRIAKAPAPVRLLGQAIGVLPQDGVLRSLTVRRVWFAEGELDAGRYLWESLRYELREKGTCLGISYDSADRLKALFRVPFWMPVVKARHLVRAKVPFDDRRRIYCVVGA